MSQLCIAFWGQINWNHKIIPREIPVNILVICTKRLVKYLHGTVVLLWWLRWPSYDLNNHQSSSFPIYHKHLDRSSWKCVVTSWIKSLMSWKMTESCHIEFAQARDGCNQPRVFMRNGNLEPAVGFPSELAYSYQISTSAGFWRPVCYGHVMWYWQSGGGSSRHYSICCMIIEVHILPGRNRNHQ